MEKSEKKSLGFLGMPGYLMAAVIIIVLVAMYTGALFTDLPGMFALMLVIGVIFKEIGDRIPIWNEYVGGGLVLAFLGSAALVYFNAIPEAYVESMDFVMSDMSFLTFFIVMLIICIAYYGWWQWWRCCSFK